MRWGLICLVDPTNNIPARLSINPLALKLQGLEPRQLVLPLLVFCGGLATVKELIGTGLGDMIGKLNDKPTVPSSLQYLNRPSQVYVYAGYPSPVL
jgi:hypothetical protein